MSERIERRALPPVAKIVAQPIPDRYARGWHYIGLGQDYANELRCMEFFGTKLVGYRGEDGKVHVLDDYCPHMGGDLGKGCLEANSVRCPFHDWRWGADGICDDIPYAKRISAKARIKQWPTMELNRMVFLWQDSENTLPTAGATIPDLGVVGTDEWTDWIVRQTPIPTNCRELIDNVSDRAHLATVNHSAAFEFTNVFENHIAVQIMKGTNDEKSIFDASEEMHATVTY